MNKNELIRCIGALATLATGYVLGVNLIITVLVAVAVLKV